MSAAELNNWIEVEASVKRVRELVVRILGQKRRSGAEFRLLRLIGMERNERYTHSSIIASLLDPRGIHGQGDGFLMLFLESFDIPESRFTPQDVIVSIEEWTGRETDDRGFIDIVLRNNQGQAIGIENKIDAPCQPNQLKRYDEYLKKITKDYQSYTLVYLTIHGKIPDQTCLGDLNPDVESLMAKSYAQHVSLWLERCLVHARARSSILKNTIGQYSASVKNLHIMHDELTTELSKIENLETVFEVERRFSGVKKELITRILENVKKLITASNLFKDKLIYREQVDNNYLLFQLNEHKSLSAGLQYEFSGTEGFYFIICRENGKEPFMKDEFRKAIESEVLQSLNNENFRIEHGSTLHQPIFFPLDSGWSTDHSVWKKYLDDDGSSFFSKIEPFLKMALELNEKQLPDDK